MSTSSFSSSSSTSSSGVIPPSTPPYVPPPEIPPDDVDNEFYEPTPNDQVIGDPSHEILPPVDPLNPPDVGDGEGI